MSEQIEDLMSFLNVSPTAWHAVDALKEQLIAKNFNFLAEGASWEILPGKSYFTIKNGSSLCAFIAPEKPPRSVHLAASHTDSPALKLKPASEFYRDSMVLWGLEVYGGPLLTSWLNRDLGIAGRVVIQDEKGRLKEKLIRLDSYPCVIPQLAIHLDPQVNEIGVVLNKQNHLVAVADLQLPDVSNSYLDWLLHQVLGEHSLLGSDLFLFPIEPAAFVGYGQEMIASYRIDSLASVHAIWKGLELSADAGEDCLKMAVFWDNEEVGSSTAQGAASPFLAHTLERIMISYGKSRKDYFQLLENSLCVSVDLAHALHPNYPEKHDPFHRPLLGKGIVLKSNTKQNYASNARTTAAITHLCQKAHIPLQHFVSRGDMPCGSTIGPIHATKTGMPTVDIGSPQLSMHGARELMACEDHLGMIRLISAFYNDQRSERILSILTADLST